MRQISAWIGSSYGFFLAEGGPLAVIAKQELSVEASCP